MRWYAGYQAMPDEDRREPALDAAFVLLACDETGLPGVRWPHREGAPHGRKLVTAVSEPAVPTESVFAWLAGEATTVRTLRRDLPARGVPKRSVDFAGYWRARLTQDDGLTEADLAELNERIADATN